jgi:hypothetical protein
MTIIRNIHSAVLVAILILTGFGSLAAEAKQTSLDARMFQAFEEIDGRTNAHEKDAVKIRARLDRLAKEIADLRATLTNPPTGGSDEDVRKQRRALHGRMIALSAEYVSQSHKLVDSAATVISENLSDLARIAEEVRNSDDPTGGAKKLQRRIRENVAAGRSMRDALLKIRTWSQLDPNLGRRFQSLQRITRAIDRRISIDKRRLGSQVKDSTGAIRSRRLEALDQTVDRLGDMYAEVMAEKEALKDLRDEVATSIQLGRLELTEDVVRRAIPNLSNVKAPSTGTDPLQEMASAVSELNQTMAGEIQRIEGPAAVNGLSRSRSALDIGDFNNF